MRSTRAWHARAPAAGETSAGVTCNPTDSEQYTGTIGLPLPNVEVRILDDHGKDVPLGEAGEIAIRGPQVMLGYWRKPQDTASQFVEGYLRTGDVEWRDLAKKMAKGTSILFAVGAVSGSIDGNCSTGLPSGRCSPWARRSPWPLGRPRCRPID